MDMKFSKIITLAIVLSTIGVTHAEWMDESTVKTAAEAFTVNDAIGATILKGCTVAGLTQRQNLWIVSLEPSGHIVMSGSDLADPIVGFSKNNFTDPDPDSPAYAMLEGTSASVAAKEAQGGTRHARWTKLLGSRGRPLLKAGAVESPDTVVIKPFLESNYNQWQPYNDYAPVFEPDEGNFKSGYEPYRGRCPCGCVATAAAQGFRHFRWPARMDRVDSFNHTFTDTNRVVVTTPFPLRFDGHVPMDWAALGDSYDSEAGGEWVPHPDEQGLQIWKSHTDLRGTVPEATRYPIARLIMFADVLAHMSFRTDGSGANYGTVALNASDWYTPGTWVSATDSRVFDDITNGIPVQVSIPGHAVVGHGWATDGTNDKYIYLNYGWGGSNDGYYNVNGSTIQEVYVGHYPRAKPQIDPLPKVCETSLTLNWHFPDFYTNNLSGFTVSISRTATTPSTFLDDFSATTGTPSSDLFAVGEDSRGYDGNLLYALSSLGSSYFTFPEKYTLTSASLLTFRLRSYYALGNSFEVQARVDDGDWITILAPGLSAKGDSGWSTERVYLGEHGGETVQLRLFKTFPGGNYYPDTKCILVDDFTITDVLAPVAPEIRNVGKTERSLALNGLTAGATYSFVVTPNISDALVPGESSESVSTSIAGTRNTPIHGEQTYTQTTLTFSASDTSETWLYSGTAVDDTSVSGGWNCSITCIVSGEITPTSTLSFDWTANDYYGVYNDADSYDVLSAAFTASDGTESLIWSVNNTSAKTSRQQVYCSLAAFNGQSGKIVISYSHQGGGYNRGGVIYAPQITNVLVPSVPAVAWNKETLTARGAPEILLAETEGFYAECGTNATAFTVQCSPNVETLRAFPSHLSLVRDEDVTIYNMGNGAFTVSLTPSGINETNFRSRMILTLAATDDNGTTTYKDLSLRFAPIDVVTAVTVNATTSSGTAFSVDIPYVWIETNGLVSPGSAASDYEAALAAKADADSDGIPNWAEYVCGTCPTNSSSKLTATIRIDENGTPDVGYDPSEGFANGFTAVIKGTNNLSEDFADWQQVTTGTKTLHFYRVEIIPE